uniref:UDP-glycosyltransferases domain-containing protein n=1 Tax=Oryza punctata TaxID=4537 RepID=A0A0E0LW82_ORYPU
MATTTNGGVPSRLRRPHVLILPLPSRGHLLPLLDFSHRLSTRHSVAITVAVAASNLPLLSAFLASTPLAAALPIQIPDASLPENSSHALLAVHLRRLRDPLLSWARSRPDDPPTVVVSDFFLGWAQLLADDLGVPRIVFYASGAFAVAALELLWNGALPLDPKSSVVLDTLPGSPAFPYEHVPSVVRSYVAGDPDWEVVLQGFRLNARAWGAVVNSFDEMEREFLEWLKRFFGHGRVWAVGPVAESGCRGEDRLPEAEQLFSWLDMCPTRSVVYVCFGTMYKPPPAQAAALGAALEASGARFVWAVGADAAVLPEGLEERTAGRGRVVRGWAPQVEILRHAAVGAFLTHCGWNSTLEGVAAGVALLAWPMKADQFIDARLVVDMHGAAVRAAEGAAAVPDPGTLARALADAVDGTKCADVRAKASVLAAAAAAAVEEGGSSRVAFASMSSPAAMSTNAAPSRRRPHALVVPFPSQGHLLPLLDFAHRLSTRHGVVITVAVTPSNLPLLSAFLASTPLAAALALPLPDTSSRPEHSRQLPPGTHHALLAVHLSGIRAPLLSWVSSHPDPPTVVVSDFFLGWAQLLADDLRVPRVAFYGVGAFTVAALEHFWNGSLPLEPSSPVVLDPLPGSPSFPYEHVPSVVRSYVAGDPDWELVREGFLLNSRAWCAVVNSFDEIEGEFLEYLNRLFGHGRVWAVGPVADSGCREEERSSEAEQLFSWLDTCPALSVVYVCFGSMYKPPPAQAAALGAALEASGARFVWAVGADVAVQPEGLEERTAGRGRVVRGWAPQMEILRHGAVGAFLTHCGWNSTLEGVAAGVVLLAWPMKADQFIDARLVVDLHGAGVRAAEGAGAVPDPGALARVFADAVDVGKLADVRAKTSALAAAAAEVVEEGGSSWIALEKMAKELMEWLLDSVDRCEVGAAISLGDKLGNDHTGLTKRSADLSWQYRGNDGGELALWGR